MRQKVVFVFLCSSNLAQADSCLFDPCVQETSSCVNVFAEGLYYYTSEVIDWGYTLEEINGSTVASYKTFDFDWAPGVRVGFMGKSPDSLYDVQAYYTGLSAHAKGETNAPLTSAFLAARLSELEPFSLGGNSELKLNYNMFNLELGASIPTTSCLLFRPALGLKGGWIDHTINSNFATNDPMAGFVTASENIEQRFEGVGPKGAISARWNFADTRICFIGLFDISYLWGYWTIKDHYQDSRGVNSSIKISPRNFGSVSLHTFWGIEWEPCCFCDSFHLKLKLGYELETWLNQFQIFSDDSGSQSNNLTFQGITFGLTACF